MAICQLRAKICYSRAGGVHQACHPGGSHACSVAVRRPPRGCPGRRRAARIRGRSTPIRNLRSLGSTVRPSATPPPNHAPPAHLSSLTTFPTSSAHTCRRHVVNYPLPSVAAASTTRLSRVAALSPPPCSSSPPPWPPSPPPRPPDQAVLPHRPLRPVAAASPPRRLCFAPLSPNAGNGHSVAFCDKDAGFCPHRWPLSMVERGLGGGGGEEGGGEPRGRQGRKEGEGVGGRLRLAWNSRRPRGRPSMQRARQDCSGS